MKPLSILCVSALLILASACGKHKDPIVTTTVDSTALYFHLHTNLDTNEVDAYNEIYTMESGRRISAGITQLYISNVQLIKADGSTYDIPAVIVYKTQETEVYSLGNVPVGSYKSVRFHIGLDSTTNTLAASSNAALDHSEMWFNPSAQPGGYVYVNFAGKVDTTTNGNGPDSLMQTFTYKLGTSAAYKEVTMPDHSPVYSFAKDIPQYIHLVVDYSKLLTGIQLNNTANLSITNATGNTTTLGITINSNIPSMFSYEE